MRTADDRFESGARSLSICFIIDAMDRLRSDAISRRVDTNSSSIVILV